MKNEKLTLDITNPELCKEWDYNKNKLGPEYFTYGSNKKVWWKCSNAHSYLMPIRKRTINKRCCPECRNLEFLYPELSKEWHPIKNKDLQPKNFSYGSKVAVWWLCKDNQNHEWESCINKRTICNQGCPYCSGRRLVAENSLFYLFKEIANEWHPIKNGDKKPENFFGKSTEIVWWQCKNDKTHEWESSIVNRTSVNRGCPYCNSAWTLDKLKNFIKSIINHIGSFSQAELYAICLQNGIIPEKFGYTSRDNFVKKFLENKVKKEDLEKFANNEKSDIDNLFTNGDYNNESEKELYDKNISANEIIKSANIKSKLINDSDAIKFLISSSVNKLWEVLFNDENKVMSEIESSEIDHNDFYALKIKENFLSEYNKAKSLIIPDNYSFPYQPNLMQKLIAVRLKESKRIGNWSGTGAGKTLSAILSGRSVNAKTTIILCNNSVIENWKNNILKIFPNSEVEFRTFDPTFQNKFEFKYLIFNYDIFHSKNIEKNISNLLNKYKIDYIIIDEIHCAKQRKESSLSKRKKNINAFISNATKENSDIFILGMSATPVINNLYEAKSLIEMISGTEQNDINTNNSIINCIKTYQKLTNIGIRYKPNYLSQLNIIEENIYANDLGEEIKSLFNDKKNNIKILELEQILTRAKISLIKKNIKHGEQILIYCHYISGIRDFLKKELEDCGYSVGFFTGDDKSGLYKFFDKEIQILIASQAITIGIDGLQNICNKLIINSLPWTNSEFEQLIGRIYRQGQSEQNVDIIIPKVKISFSGNDWSWCNYRMKIIKSKKSISDAAVDGILPSSHLITPQQAYKSAKKWLERIENGEINEQRQDKIYIPLNNIDIKKTNNKNTEKSICKWKEIQNRWSDNNSETIKNHLILNPDEWNKYHLYRENFISKWDSDPCKKVADWCKNSDDKLIIGDFGCGYAKIYDLLKDSHKVYNFDFIAKNDSVIACDMSKTPLENSTLDVSIFCLSLITKDFINAIYEVHRVLKINKYLHIIEPKNKFSNLNEFVKNIELIGFKKIDIVNFGVNPEFTHILMLKYNKDINKNIKINF